MANNDARLYQIALTMLPGIGSVLAKNLIAYCGSPENVFKTPRGKLEKIPQIGEERAIAIAGADILKQAEEELKFVEEYGIQTLFFTDAGYPQRLKEFNDSPVLLFYKGTADLNTEKIAGIVGTRRCTQYGKEVTKKLCADLAAQNVLVISGLAFGIDTAAHQSALDSGLKTVGVLGHGLNTIYPPENKGLAKKMVEQGGLLTEYTSNREMHPSFFPERNRIVAGMCDAVVVVESTVKGGAVITANIAHSYNKDVFAFPGKSTDKASEGCNFLIKSNKATLIENAEDLLNAMRWKAEDAVAKPRVQRQLLFDLSADEQTIYQLLNERTELEIDVLTAASGLASGTLAATLLEMEMNGLVISLPGKRYKLTQ